MIASVAVPLLLDEGRNVDGSRLSAGTVGPRPDGGARARRAAVAHGAFASHVHTCRDRRSATMGPPDRSSDTYSWGSH